MKQPVFDTTPETSKRMSHVPHEGGKAETLLAKALWHRGYRYRLNYRKIIGSPDIALTKYKIAVFVDGELWHGYDWENKKAKLVRNREYWIHKIENNMHRDEKVNSELTAMGVDTFAILGKGCDKGYRNVYKCNRIDNTKNYNDQRLIRFSTELLNDAGKL